VSVVLVNAQSMNATHATSGLKYVAPECTNPIARTI
jgi:hypothetical protein